MERKIPDRLHIEKKDRALYEELRSVSMYRDKETKDLFLMAMAFGFKNDTRRKIETKEGFARTEYLKPKDLALINAVAITQESVELLDNPEEVFKLAEEYANAGIKLLVGSVDSVAFGSYEKQLEKELLDMHSRIIK